MNCPKCKRTASGNYCTHCGTKLKLEALDKLTKYGDIISDERCQKVITQWAGKGKNGMTAIEFLQYAQLVLPGRWPLAAMALFSAKVGEKLDLGKENYGLRVYHYPYPYVILAVMASLARQSLIVKNVYEGEKRCYITAGIPSTVLNLEGRLEVIVVSEKNKTRVMIEAKIFGQWLDFGKTGRLVDKMLKDIGRLGKRFMGDKELKLLNHEKENDSFRNSPKKIEHNF